VGQERPSFVKLYIRNFSAGSHDAGLDPLLVAGVFFL